MEDMLGASSITCCPNGPGFPIRRRSRSCRNVRHQQISYRQLLLSTPNVSLHKWNLDSCSHRTFHRWFNEEFQDTKLSPHVSDYCSTCTSYKTELNSLEESKSKHCQQAEPNTDRIRDIQHTIDMINAVMTAHRKEVMDALLTDDRLLITINTMKEQ